MPGVWDSPLVPSPASPSRPSPSLLMQAVQAAVAALRAADPAGLPTEQALTDLDGLLRAQQDLRRVVISALGDARVRRTYGVDNEPSLGSWLRRRHPERPTADISLTQQLRNYPLLRERVLSGQLTCDADRQVANALTHTRANVDRPDELIDGQPARPVLDAITDNTPDLIRTWAKGHGYVTRTGELPRHRVDGDATCLRRPVSSERKTAQSWPTDSSPRQQGLGGQPP